MTQVYKLLTCLLVFIIMPISVKAQAEREIAPPYNIKTASFVKEGNNVYPYFRLGESIEFVFDDLFGNEADYYYTLTHCNYDWRQSQLTVNDYLQGFDNQRIQNYANSFNTLQIYSRYTLNFPNKFTRIILTGNYVLKILNADREVVFTRKFIVYEENVAVPLQIKRARGMDNINQKHNLDFSIRTNAFIFQSPLQNVKVTLFQNGRFDNAIYDVKPQYTIGNDLIYKYDRETQFWAGNEYLYFDNKDIRNAINNVLRITAGEIYNTILYPNVPKAFEPYTYYPDVNGNYVVRNVQLSVSNPLLESDYTWVFFSLNMPEMFDKKDVYVGGMFNNYARIPEYKMEFNQETGMYEKAVMMKQGFTNFQYFVTDKQGRVDAASNLDGNFYQTENDYNVFVYYRENNERYDRVIGMGTANSTNIIN